MKKSIFDLTREEGKKIDKEMRKTSYYKQYLMEYLLTIMIFAFILGSSIGFVSANDSISSQMIEMLDEICIVLGLGFIAVISILFAFKRFDLVKKYYEEKVKKD